MLIQPTKDYFNREYSVPNISEMYSDSYENLSRIINLEVPRVLLHVLGIDLFNELENELVDGLLPSTASQKWLDFVYGKEYTKDGKKRKYKGLIYKKDDKVVDSLLVKLCFHHWLQFNATFVSQAGEQSLNVTNSQTVINNKRLVDSWNDFLSDYQGENDYHGGFKIIHKGVLYEDFFAEHKSQIVSVVTFLKDNPQTYKDASCGLYRSQNTFNL